MPKDIITKLKESKLVGRSGSAFPTFIKWRLVKNTKAEKKYIICNASEGEPAVFKDTFIIKNHAPELIDGIKIALQTIDNSCAIIYLKKENYVKFKKRLQKLAKGLPLTIFKKEKGYIAGEETVACEVMEGKTARPRIKPPFVCQSGLFGFPTLVNNVETFYWVSKIEKGEYKGNRFYSISGKVKRKGVFEFSERWTIEKILKESGNFPDFDFFVKVGGGATGRIFLPKELKQIVPGAGAIIVFDRSRTNLLSLMQEWAEFFHQGNCDKCVPCREGAFRILENIKTKELNRELLEDFFFVLEETSFCALGKGIPGTFRDTMKKLLK